MKAGITRRNAVFIEEAAKPGPGDGQILVRVQASSICAADYRIKSLPQAIHWVMGTSKGKILGMELAGTVEAVGKDVTRFRPGDRVFGATGFKFGTHAEYVCVAERGLELLPSNMSMEEGAAVAFGGVTALCFLRKAAIQAGQRVLVYGASGSVGVFAVQLAKHFGAQVTAVCSGPNVEMVRSLGADEVVDYTKDDYSRAGRIYDVLVDTVGGASYASVRRALKHGGPLIGIGVQGKKWSQILAEMLKTIPLEIWLRVTGAAKPMGGVTKAAPGDLAFLKSLIEAGKLRTVIDRCYSLDHIADAFRYAETGRKRGHVVIRVAAG